jgi:hypothetical protein
VVVVIVVVWLVSFFRTAKQSDYGFSVSTAKRQLMIGSELNGAININKG